MHQAGAGKGTGMTAYASIHAWRGKNFHIVYPPAWDNCSVVRVKKQTSTTKH
jgi:hypothetical protein